MSDNISYRVGRMYDPSDHSPIGYEVQKGDSFYLRFFDGNVVCFEEAGYEVFYRDFGNFVFDQYFNEQFDEWRFA